MATVCDDLGAQFSTGSMNGAVFRDQQGISYTTPTFTNSKFADDTGIVYDISSPNGMKLQDDKGIWFTAPTFTNAQFQDSFGLWFTPGALTGGLLAWAVTRKRKRIPLT